MYWERKSYPEGQFKPESARAGEWIVWCATGAIQVLERKEYDEWLKSSDKDDWYIIVFARGGFADIRPEHKLYKMLAEIAKSHKVEVFPTHAFKSIFLYPPLRHVPWTGNDPCFDAIRIRAL